MKRNDFALILVLILITVTAWFFINGPTKAVTEGEAVIYQGGREYSAVPLDQDDTIIVETENGGINIIEIKDGKVQMIQANCPDQICVHTRPADKDGQSVVCLPNRVAVEVRSAKKTKIDGVSE